MNILIIAEYLGDIRNPDMFNSRFLTIADMLLAKGHIVKIVTTDYVHHLKQHVSGINKYKTCDLVTLHEPGYQKNVSLKRFLSHYILSKNLKKWLADNDIPDLIYCAVPSLDFAYEAAKYARKKEIKFVLDVQDLWPEAFEMVFNIPVVSKVLFSPFRVRANYIYSSANEIVAVSETYAKKAMKTNKLCKSAKTVYLGTDLSKFDTYKEAEPALQKQENEIWLGYVGTLGHSYDLKMVFESMELLKNKLSGSRLKFIVMGDGPLKKHFEKLAENKELNVRFLGMLSYPQMVATLCKCDFVVNPIKSGSAGSIINKHADYAASGLPVLNTQESEEYRKLVTEYNMGFNCENGASMELAEKIDVLIQNRELCAQMGENARLCAEKKFDRRITYTEICKLINAL